MGKKMSICYLLEINVILRKKEKFLMKKEQNLVCFVLFYMIEIGKYENLRFMETSAKESLNIKLTFESLAMDIMARMENG